jgi:geranylgeranyl pyrophosphate synthase
MDEVLIKNKPVHTVPQSYAGRNRLRKIIDVFVSGRFLVPPLSMRDLSEMSELLIREYDLCETWKGWLMVEINNCVWKDTVASVPYNKRILLLPQCLSNYTKCKAEMDELGLLCRRCNNCIIPDLQDKAEDLGMMSIVAEGFTAVMGLIESGVIQTVIGIGCLESLEKAFPLLVNHAIPGMAIPLNKAGCKDTRVDSRYVESLMRMYSPGPVGVPGYETIKTDIKEWFSSYMLEKTLKEAGSAGVVAREWLSGDGKRWRPFLLVAVYLSMTGKTDIPEFVRLAAVAVECFHKASLVHDDIQDDDAFRYGKQTIHSLHGVPIAINVGDLLLGEGYRILSLCNCPELVQTAASAHISLCKGQGMELEWSRFPHELTLSFVLDIFRCKTVPAFEVALDFGVLCAGDDERLRSILHEYSLALGIAYQLQDDAEDYDTEDATVALRPSAVLAVLCEQNKAYGYIGKLSGENDINAFLGNEEHKPRLQKAIRKVRILSEEYRRRAIDALSVLDNSEMKRLLFRVTEKILNRTAQ